MKLLFSEARADYGHYVFPYAVWGFPDETETPADFFERGFLPSSRNLDRFYLCRHVRVKLAAYSASSENRRVLRKGARIRSRLLARAEFDFSAERREFCKRYADARFGPEVMPYQRLDSLFESKIVSHVLLFTAEESGCEVGLVTLYLEAPTLAYYYHAFYDISWRDRNLGMFMMTSAVSQFAEVDFRFLYLGSCYVPNALYKTQFAGAEFFNGVSWSSDLDELKYLLRRGAAAQTGHLLESEEYREQFHGQPLAEIAACSPYQVKIRLPDL